MKMNGIEDFMTPDCLDITEPNEETKGSHCRSSCRQELEEG